MLEPAEMSRKVAFTSTNLTEIIHGFHSSEAASGGFTDDAEKQGRVVIFVYLSFPNEAVL